MGESEKSTSLSGYELSRAFFDWCFENPELVNPNHIALYFFIVEHCNRLGWKNKFGLPSSMAKDAIGIKNYRTYTKTLYDLVGWGFIKIIQESKNQYTSCIVAIVKNTKAHTKAYDKALHKHIQKQVHGIVSIDKPINQEPITNNDEHKKSPPPQNFHFAPEPILTLTDLSKKYKADELWIASVTKTLSLKRMEAVSSLIDKFLIHLETQKTTEKTEKDFRDHFVNWARKQKPEQPPNTFTGFKDHFL